MSGSLTICFVLTIFLLYPVRGNEVCDFADIKCWTNGVKFLYRTLVHGVEGLVPPLDPLNVGSFTSEIPDVINVTACNATFLGLKQCSPILLKFRENEYKYDYILRCPKLYLKARVRVDGCLGAVKINNCDNITVVAEEYLVKATGKYGVFIADDQSSRFYLEDFIMDTEPQGPITLETEHMFGLHKSQGLLVEHYLKENWRVLEKQLRYPAMYLFMSTLVKEGDVYLRATPRAYIFPKTETTCQELCDLDDEKCITKAARFVFSNILTGVKGVVEPLEPFIIPNITGEIPGLEYKLTNATFTGLNSCIPEEKLNKDDSSYYYILKCSHLVLNAIVKAKGRIGHTDVDGSDSVTITADDYYFTVQGHYGIFISKEDQSSHFYLKDFNMDTRPKERISFDTNNMFGIPKKQAHRASIFMRNNWRILEKLLRYPTMHQFISVILNKIDLYLRATPIDKIIPKYRDSNVTKINPTQEIFVSQYLSIK